MKVLFLSTSSVGGGAFIAASRIYSELRRSDMDVTMLTRAKAFADIPLPKGIYNYRPFIRRLLSYCERMIAKIYNDSNPISRSLNIFPSGLANLINRSNYDLIHLHWINDEMMSIMEIGLINKPIVWTLHDCWAFSGTEHHDIHQTFRWKTGYNKSDQKLKSFGIDLDRWLWKKKQIYWRNSPFHFVAPSNWLANRIKHSKLFRNRPVSIIPNGLDTEVFRPHNKQSARDRLGLPKNQTILLFGAMNSTNDPIKGFDLLIKTLDILADNNSHINATAIVFGNLPLEKTISCKMPISYKGIIKDDRLLAMLYSSADLMLTPSRQEIFGQCASEALTCGTPVCAFKIGGLTDIIDHMQNGYLAQPYDPIDLAHGIQWLLKDKQRLAEMGRNARAKAVECFDQKNVARQYRDLYKQVLNS
ncbi:MAG: glycosyltransferase [Candidatus Marinimicrobia bacterium]|nr:glycosyltransferase [Candidatus Neomarinimicrobiota bacterium]